MLRHMRTTVEISDSLLARARKVQQRRHTTLRALVEEGLNRVLAEESPIGAHPRRAAFSGQVGLVEPLQPGDLPELLKELRRSGRDAG